MNTNKVPKFEIVVPGLLAWVLAWAVLGAAFGYGIWLIYSGVGKL